LEKLLAGLRLNAFVRLGVEVPLAAGAGVASSLLAAAVTASSAEGGLDAVVRSAPPLRLAVSALAIAISGTSGGGGGALGGLIAAISPWRKCM
jgi:hypothetical protein